jgi:hypothetical protein
MRIVFHDPMDITFDNIERERPTPAGQSLMTYIGVPEQPQLLTPEK